jgi:superfamily II DNA or RNA helicase
MLTRTGYVVPESSNLKAELTVRGVENAVGIRPPSFKVFRADKGKMCIPRYYGEQQFGKAKDYRPEPNKTNILFNGRLRDFQTEAHRSFLDSESGGVLSIYCGGGKTTIALAIAASLKLRVFIIVHKEFLANQWRERIHQFCPGATVGLVQGDKCELEHDFVIGMIQTMCQRSHPMGTFDSIGLLIVDEAHHIGAPAFSQFMFKLCPKYTLGLTATPERKDGLTRLLYWFLGPEFYRLEREDQEHVKVHKIDFNCPEFRKGIPVNKIGQISIVEMINILVDIPERNKVLIDIVAASPQRKVLILTDRRTHCFELQEAIEGSALYIGGMKEKDLEISSQANIIIATFSQAHEGLDIPSLDTVILATPHSDVKQAVGRILRGGNKNPPLIYDIVDNWSVLFGMWKKRLAMYKSSGFDCGEEKETGCLF